MIPVADKLFPLERSHFFRQVNVVGFTIIAACGELVFREEGKPFRGNGKEVLLFAQKIFERIGLAVAQVVQRHYVMPSVSALSGNE